MAVMEAVREMNTAQKLALMETLWEDLRIDEANVPSPAWHAEALAQARADYEAGRATFADWEEVKGRLRNELLHP
jgi:hypothetical protein